MAVWQRLTDNHNNILQMVIVMYYKYLFPSFHMMLIPQLLGIDFGIGLTPTSMVVWYVPYSYKSFMVHADHLIWPSAVIWCRKGGGVRPPGQQEGGGWSLREWQFNFQYVFTIPVKISTCVSDTNFKLASWPPSFLSDFFSLPYWNWTSLWAGLYFCQLVIWPHGLLVGWSICLS